jgi:hypothetical protein
VSSAHEFYDYADEHFGWAETAKTERERAIFLQMAAAWLEVAQQWEAAEGAGEIAQAALAGTSTSVHPIQVMDCGRCFACHPLGS